MSGTAVSEGEPPKRALFVDLDGTLVATDVLWEAFVHAIKKQPWILLLAPLWLLRGRAGLKRAISERSAPDAAALPYRDEVLDFIRQRRDGGDAIVLATASDQKWADDVATEVGLFDDVIASDGRRNLKGSHKLKAIEAYCRDKGYGSWGYMGDSTADLPIWARAGEVHVVDPSAGLLAQVRKHGEPARVFGKRGGRLKPLVKAMRPHQWVKNVLLFVPLVLAREITNLELLIATFAAFGAFSLCASSVYVVNDLFDVEADRAHPRKRKRPFAAGTLPLMYGPPLVVLLLAIAFTGAYLLLPIEYVGVLVLYLLVNGAYSSVLKSKLLVDVIILASLYTLRVFAGGVATGLEVSEWLLAFAIFIFTSLAFAKRYVELSRLETEGKTMAKGRGYQIGDLSLILSVGPASGYLAVLVFALYISNGVPDFYTHKNLLWLTCPLLLYWISRLWFLAKRQELNDDPVVFAVTDKASLAVGALVGLLVLLAAPLW